jgi:hypothetical protein
MNLLKQLSIQVFGSAMGITLLVVTKFPMTSWLDAIWGFSVIYIGYASPMLLSCAVISNVLNPKCKEAPPYKPPELP